MKTKSPEIQAILFDMDGTIIDTEPTAVNAVKECFLEWNLPLHIQDATYLTGRTWENAFEFLFQKYTPPIPLETAKHTLLERYRLQLKSNLITVPGSVVAIQELAQHFPLALVSGSQRSEILWALEHLGVRSCFKCILGAEDYPRSKPEPDGYLKAMKELQVAPDQCLIFEDSTAGIRSGRAAGSWVVAVTSTNHFEQDLSSAHLQIPDLTAVHSKWIRDFHQMMRN